MDLKKQLPQENLKIMSRIVNVAPGIIPFTKLKDEYRKHKKRVKTLSKIEKVVEVTQPSVKILQSDTKLLPIL